MQHITNYWSRIGITTMIYINIDIVINIDIHKLHYNTPNESYNFPVEFCSNSVNSIAAGTPTTRYGMESLGIHYQPLLSTTR